MPLPQNSPDLHAIAEHGVRIAKSAVKTLAVESDPADFHGEGPQQGNNEARWGLLTTKPWQDAVVNAFAERSHEDWRHLVKRGVDKMLCLATILSTPAGEKVNVHYNFIKDDSDLPVDQRAVVEAVGSAGQWQFDSRFNG